MDRGTNGMSQEEIEERKHFNKVLQTFRSYQKDSKTRLKRSQVNVKGIPPEHQKLLSKFGYQVWRMSKTNGSFMTWIFVAFQDHLQEVEACIDKNYDIVLKMIENANTVFENVPATEVDKEQSPVKVCNI